ncbi:MAG: hypothetical protein GXY81_01925 [Candidatus Cloacimonetes bacterium]|nr:hypothetical protein [Candidatus Cloacimonadota bacterium]
MKPLQILSLSLVILLFSGLIWADSQPPRLGADLVLPAGWPVYYEPPEVLLRVVVNPDSSLSLGAVIDGKDELEPLLVEYLKQFDYIPAGDSLSLEPFAVIVPIFQPDESQFLDKRTRQALLEEIETWIADDRASYSLHSPMHTPIQTGGLNFRPEPYRSAFYYWGYPQQGQGLSVNGFEPRSFIFSPVWNEHLIHGFMQRGESALGLDYEDKIFPYEATLSEVEAGLGGANLFFARGLLKKTGLFGVKGMRMGFGFLIQDGDWFGLDSGHEGLALDFGIPLGKSNLSFSYQNHRTQMSHRLLKPEYWWPQEVDFTVERRYQSLQAQWTSPWLNLALLGESDHAKSARFADDIHAKTLQLQAWENLRLGPLGIKIFYEGMLSDTDLNFMDDVSDHLAGLELDFERGAISLETGVELEGFKELNASADLGFKLGRVRFGAFGAFSQAPRDPVLYVSDPYQSGAVLPRVEIHENYRAGLQMDWFFAKNSQLRISAGRRGIFNQYPPELQSPYQDSAKIEENPLFLHFARKWDETWGAWKLDRQSGATVQTVQFGLEELLYEPVVILQDHFNLYRLLSHNNALFAGLSVQGYMTYFGQLSSLIKPDASFIADFWAGVQIGKRFEFQLSYKNAFNGSFYFIPPIPATLQGSLRWYFLN